ncbi:MAG: TetR family transcriptional regulator [Phycisphaerae bacterium]|nr:TetR family transcriptional regulator [Phycisphaerae bacterium]
MVPQTKRSRRRRNSRQSEKRILQAAAEVFAEKGPDAATVDEICRKAKRNKRMIYHYFASKAGLYRRVLQSVYEKFLSLEIELAAMLLSPEELLDTVVSKYVDFLHEHPDFVRILSHENLNEGRVARELKLAGGKSNILEALRLLVEKGQTEGRFRRDVDLDELLISIFGLCFFPFSNRHTMSELLGRSIITPSRLKRRKTHIVRLLLMGLYELPGNQ